MKSKKNTAGNCFEVSGRFALNGVTEIYNQKFIGIPYVVQAEVLGQGSLENIRFGHSWVEDDFFVYDFSNGLNLIYPKQRYYMVGQVIEEKPTYFKYTFVQATKKMLDTGNFGPWDLITSTGL